MAGRCPGHPRLQSLKRSPDSVDARDNPQLKPWGGHDAGSAQKRSVPLTGQQWACSGYPRLWNYKRSVDFVDARGNPRFKPEDGHDGGSVRRRSAP